MQISGKRILFCVMTMLAMLFCGTMTLLVGNNAFAKSGIDFVVEKNEIERVQLDVNGSLQLRAGQSATLQALVFPEIARATVEEVSFKIVRGSQFASISGNQICINKDAPVGKEVEVATTVDKVEGENSLVFSVVRTPAEKLEILNKKTRLAQGEVLMLSVDLQPLDVTNEEVVFCITQGQEYATLSQDGLLCINSHLPQDNLQVCVRVASASDPDIFAIKTFELYIPVIEIEPANSDLKEVQQQGKYSFKVDENSLNEWNKVVYSVDVESDTATIDENGVLSVSETAEIGTKINVKIEIVGNNSYTQEVTVVPVYATSMLIARQTKPNKDGLYLPETVLDFDVIFPTPFNVSDCNKNFSLKVSNPLLAQVEGHSVKIAKASEIEMENPSFVVSVLSNQNGITLKQDVEIGVYVPATSLHLTALQENVQEGTTYKLSNLLQAQLLPHNCTNKEVTYSLLDNAYASLVDEQLVVKDALPAGKLMLEIQATTKDGVVSNTVAFEIYKPTKTLVLTADNTNPISSIQSGECVNLFTATSPTASQNNAIISIVKGAENIEGTFQNGDQIEKSFLVKKNLSQCLIDREIVLKAVQDGIIAQVALEVYIPNEELTLSAQPLSRGKFETFSVTHSKNADDVSWKVVDFDRQHIEEVSQTSGTIKVKQNTSAGTKVWVKVCTNDRLKKESTFEFVVDKMFSQHSQVVSKFGILEAGKFNILLDKDSAGVKLDKNNPQIFVGRSANVEIMFGGMALQDFGLSFAGLEFLGDNVDANASAGGKICVKQTASGRSFVEAKAIIRDGEEQYEIVLPKIGVFRPLQGQVKFADGFKLMANGTNLRSNLVAGQGFDNNATYTFGLLDFEAGSSEGGISISDGIVTVTAANASATQTLKISTEEKYNGQKIAGHPNFCCTLLLPINTQVVENGGNFSSIVNIAGSVSKVDAQKTGYIFDGFYFKEGNIEKTFYDKNGSLQTDLAGRNEKVYGKWRAITYKVATYTVANDATTHRGTTNYSYDQDYTLTAPTIDKWQVLRWCVGSASNEYCGASNTWKPGNLSSTNGATVNVYIVYEKSPTCVASGTLVTLADGSQKKVEQLEMTDKLLVWNFETGAFDSADILFVDVHEEAEYVVTRLTFEDGSTVDMIDEHGFWDVSENKFVYITKHNFEQFVGHLFNKASLTASGMQNTNVRLVKAENIRLTTTAWSPVTASYLSLYVNGFLSMPSETQAFVNIFEVDKETMKIDEEKMLADIEKYGLFTYEDFAQVPPEIFDLFGGAYLKIALAKGSTTMQEILRLIEKYSSILFEEV